MGFSGYMPRSRVAGSYGSSIFSILRKLHTVLPTVCTITFPPTVLEGSLYPAFICRFFDDGHSDSCEVTPHCSFDLHFSDRHFKHLFRCFLILCMSSLEKCRFRSSSPFSLESLVSFFLCFDLELHDGLYISEINPLSVALFANIFSHPVDCLFVCSFF